MSVGRVAALYGICAAAFFAMDFIWLSTAVPRICQPALGVYGEKPSFRLLAKPNVPGAAVFYQLYVVGILALAFIPGIREGAVIGALWRGAPLGLIAYATYDLTNLSTLVNRRVNVTIIDMIWGLVLNSVAAIVGFYAGAKLLRLS